MKKGGLVVFLWFCFVFGFVWRKKKSGRKTDAIQKRAAYFGCIAALDGSSEALAPAERPFSSWPASSVPPRSSRARTGGAGWRRSFADSTTRAGRGHHRSWPRSGGENRDRREGVRLASRVRGSVGRARRGRPDQSQAYSPKAGRFLAGPGMGGDSRRPPAPPPNIFPLLMRLSMARSTSERRGRVSFFSSSSTCLVPEHRRHIRTLELMGEGGGLFTGDGGASTCWWAGRLACDHGSGKSASRWVSGNWRDWTYQSGRGAASGGPSRTVHRRWGAIAKTRSTPTC